MSFLYILGAILLIVVGVVALVRAKGSPSPGAVRTAGVLMVVAALAQFANSVVSFATAAMRLPFEALITVSGLANLVVELVYGLTVTGALVALAVALVRSKSAAARAAGPAAAGPAAGHAFAPPAPGRPYGSGQARSAPPEHGRPGYGHGHPGTPVGPAEHPGHPGPEGHAPPPGGPGGGTGWSPGNSGGFGGGGSSSADGGGSSSGDGGGGGD
ncbi:hypothetical protein [Nocardiopsis deserti]|uniref:hypothetical protein n=1 Tax=Nocardiopsis deserti TaxID=2605988 RepID=UPI0012390B1C|nr:hypothetical protein [Nocardiopsis deserti]